MARERLVTRTLKTTEGTGLFVDEEAKEVIERVWALKDSGFDCFSLYHRFSYVPVDQ